MGSRDQDELKIRRREESLARRVGEALGEMDAHNEAHCPDREILAAYAEQGLGPAETEKWESHFALCSRCRKILLALAASAATPLAEKDATSLGTADAPGRNPMEITSSQGKGARPKRLAWRARWLAPAFGVAAALAVWLAVRAPWRTTGRGDSVTLIAQAPRQEPQPTNPPPQQLDRLSNATPGLGQPEKNQKAGEEPSNSSAKTIAPSSSPSLKAKQNDATGGAFGAGASNSPLSPGVLKQDKKSDNEFAGREVSPAPLPRAAVPPAPQPAPAIRSDIPPVVALTPQAGTPPNTVADRLSREKEADAPKAQAQAGTGSTAGQVDAPESRAGARPQQAFALERALQKDSSLLRAPSSSTVWRIGKGGAIERSLDGGATWVLQISPSPQDWLAGAAVSNIVCWVAGRSGAIARTIDGEHWERIAAPRQAAGAGGAFPDWTAVSATGAQTATVTTADGRRFATTDGGATWRPL